MMRYALVIDDAPLLYAGLLNRVLRQVRPQPVCVLTVPGLKDPALKKRYTRAVMRIVGRGYAARLVGRYVRGGSWSFGQVARRHGVPLRRFDSVNEPGFRAHLQALGVTTVFSTTAEIYRAETLALPGVAFYNFHGSLLPAHKGLLPLFWAFLADAPQGVTVHAITERIDAGAIVFQERLDGAPDPSLPAMLDLLLARFPNHLARAIHHLSHGLPPAPVAPPLPASYEPVPADADIDAYFARLRCHAGKH